MSDIEAAIWEQYSDKGVTVLGISNERTETILQFVNDLNLSFPVLKDNAGAYTKYYLDGGLSPYPRDFIVDQHQMIQYANTEYNIQAMSLIVQSLIEDDHVGIDDATNRNVPKRFELGQNYPNPFNPKTTIPFVLNRPAQVELAIVNVLGKTIMTLIHGDMQAGYHVIEWDGRDGKGRQMPSGIYLYRLRIGEQTMVRKLVFAR